jgi:hypothetical protein
MAEHFISKVDAANDLLTCAAYLAESVSSGETHAAAVAAVVPYFLEGGNVDLAAELANAVDDPFTRDRLLISVVAKCADLDDDEYALQLVEAIEDTGLQAQGYEQVGYAKADKGQLEKAADIAVMMVHPDGILVRIAARKAADGDLAGALSTIREIEFARDAVIAFNSIAAAKIRNEENEPAVQMLSLAEEKAAEIEHDEERIRSYCEIGNLFIEAGEKGKAVQVFETARAEAEELDNMHRDALLAHTAIGFLSAGSVDFADRTLDAIADKTQIATVLLAFARDHWQKDEREDAVEALEEAFAVLRSQHENETRDSRAKFNTLGTVAAQFAGFQKCERAIEVADVIPDESHRTNALSQIAQIAVTSGLYEIAGQAASEIKGELEHALTLMGMGRAARDAGDLEMSDKFVTEAESSVSKLLEPTARYNALLELSKLYHLNGEPEKRDACFDDAMAALVDVRNSNFKVTGLAELSKMQDEFDLRMNDDRCAALGRFF